MNTKTCGKCSRSLPETSFSWRNKKDGIKQPYCKACMRDYNKAHYMKNKDKYISRAKRNKKRAKKYILEILSKSRCADCGMDDIRVLEFDHINGDKEINISIAMNLGWSNESLDAEIAKCEVRCKNCHAIRHSDGSWRDI